MVHFAQRTKENVVVLSRLFHHGCSVLLFFGMCSCAGSVGRRPESSSPPSPPSSQSSPAQPSVAVLPPEWMTLTPQVSVDVTAAVILGLEESGGVSIQDPAMVASELASHEDSCAEDIECIRRMGQRLDSDKTITVHLAELGSTTLIKMSVLDVAGDGRESIQQATVSPTTAEGVEETVREMAREVGLSIRPPQPRPEPRERRWYQRWWVWTLISVGVAGAAVAIAVPLVTSDDDDPPGIVITPP